jgi:hypothetical protein
MREAEIKRIKHLRPNQVNTLLSDVLWTTGGVSCLDHAV